MTKSAPENDYNRQGDEGGGEARRVTVTFYLDVFFMVNFVMDYLLLLLVRQILHLPPPGEPAAGTYGAKTGEGKADRAKAGAAKTGREKAGAAAAYLGSRLRIPAAAAAGGLWACAAVLLPGMPGWLGWCLTWFLVGGGMVLLAFGRRPIREFFRSLLALWLVSAAAAGVCGLVGDMVPAAWYLTGSRPADQWQILTAACVAAGIFFGGCACADYLREKSRMQEHLYQVTLHYRGNTKTVRALWDTGNQLYEPYGHQPVHVITYEACRGLCGQVSRVIYIPFRSVGTGYGMLPGIQVDEMDVEREGRLVKRYQKPWLAISREPLSSRHQYEMLLHGEQ